MSTFSFELKLKRALQYRDLLEAQLGGRTPSDAYRIADELDHQSGDHLVRIYLGSVDGLSLLVGDLLHCYRSALDHLAYSLALKYTGSPLPPDVAESPSSRSSGRVP